MGSSYSGGHVIVVAAADQRVAGVISQGAAMDGLAALLGVRQESGSGTAVALTRAGLGDLARAARRRAPLMLPITGPPGSDAVISAPGGQEGYGSIMGPTFRNEMCARGTLRIATNRPVRHADKITCPVLLVAAEQDNIAPVGSVHDVAERIGDLAETLSLDVGHFEIYTGEAFERNIARQLAFLRRLLSR